MERHDSQKSGSQNQSKLNRQRSRNVDALEESLQNIMRLYKQSELQLKKTETNFKLFLNMVIHDMRNPTNSIQHGLASVIQKLGLILKPESHHQNYQQSVAVLRKTLMEVDAQPNEIVDQLDTLKESFGANTRQFDEIEQMLKELQRVAKMNDQEYMQHQSDEIQDEDNPIDDIQEPEVIVPRSFESSSSCLHLEKRDRIYQEIEKTFQKEHINIDCQKFKASLNKFLKETLFATKPSKTDSQSQTDNSYLVRLQSQKIEIDQKIGIIKLKVREGKNQTINNLENWIQMIIPIQLNVSKYLSKQLVYQRQFADFVSYYDNILVKIFKESKHAEMILQMQVFSQRMVENLINDLLDLAKLENSSFTLHNEYFDLAATIEEAYKILAYQATDRCITLDAIIEDPSNLKMIRSVYGDKRRFLQLMLNFLSNALKFTHQGGTVTTFIEIIDEQMIGDDNFVNFRLGIKDTGVGISEENLKNLFIDFSRLSENEEMNQSGTGLGLSICKQIIEQMGGSVTVESKIGQGSIFLIQLSTKYQTTRGQPILEQVFIQKLGNSLEVNSKLEKIIHQNSNQIPLDMQDHGAYDEFYASHLKKVNYLIEKSYQIQRSSNQIVVFDSKVDVQSLNQNILRQNNPQIYDYDQDQYEEEKKEESLRVLIANDEIFQLQILCDMFKGKHFDVTSAVNGHEAFLFAQKSLQGLPYDLVVLDLEMPISNGYETCKKILSLYDNSRDGIFNLLKSGNSLRKKQPLMIACSGYVDDRVRDRTVRSGFDMALQCPLKSCQVDKIIMPMLIEKKQKIQNDINCFRKQSGQLKKAIKSLRSELFDKEQM